MPPAPRYLGKQTAYVPSNLASTGFVYVRIDAHCHPLKRPYDGPYRIIDTSEKFFTLNIKGRPEKVSVDRLKAAFVTPLTTSDQETVVPPGPPNPPVVSCGAEVPPASSKTKTTPGSAATEPSPPAQHHPVTTRSGRVSRLPFKFR